MRDSILYICYSNPLMKFLELNGIRYELTGLSLTTQKQFYVYLRTEELNQLLVKWANNKK